MNPSPHGRPTRLLLSLSGGVLLAISALSSATCTDDTRSASVRGAAVGSAEPAAEAAARVEALRARFDALRTWTPRAERASELRVDEAGRLEAVLPAESAVDVTLPATADGETSIVDRASKVGAHFSLAGASASPHAVVGDLAIYRRAAEGAGDLLHRVDGSGVEDLVAFDVRPAREELRYHLRPEGARALRLVSDHLEVIDAKGVPRVRVEPPWVVDARGVRTAASIDVEGCAVDRDPRAPWGRDLVELGGATSCDVVVRWSGVDYPLLVDPEWKDSGFMTRERTHHTATLLPSGSVLLAGGFDVAGNAVPDAEIMCPAEFCPPVPIFTPTGSLQVARGGQTETLLHTGTDVLYTGGRPARASATRLGSAEVYSTVTGTFVATAGPMTNARAEHTATLLDATGGFKVLVTGGDGLLPTSSAELFDPATGTFAATGNMTVQRRGHFAEILKSGHVLVGGGISTLGIAVASAEIFDPTTSTFTATGNMTSQRAFTTATRLEDAAGSVLVTGGTNAVGFYYKTADLFIPSGNGGSFQQQPIIMQAARAYHSAVKLLGTGTVLVTGGYDGTSVLDTAEVFDQATAQFVLGSSQMKRARAFHTATRLPSGQAVVTGGGFDPGAGTVTFSTAISTETLERSNSEPCNIDTECASGHCVQTANLGKICCDTECGGVCQACANDQTGLTTGECHDVLDNTLVKPACDNAVQLQLLCIGGQVTAGNVLPCAPYACAAAGDKCGAGTCASQSDCSKDGWCGATGCSFKQELASQCATDVQCKSGHCVDGFCCDTACGGQCEACDDAAHPGFCSQVVGKPHGTRTVCSGTGGACEGTCGSTRDACDYKANDCGNASCVSGVENSGTCSLTSPGTCVTGPKDCGAFACDTSGARCNKTCQSVADCAAGAVCQNGICTAVENDACDGDHTVVRPDGTSQDCGAFRCSGSACLDRCNSVDDCVSPNVCNDKGKCIPPPASPPAPSGCAIATSARDPGLAGALTIFAAAISLARRKRRPKRAPRSTDRGGVS